MFFFANQSPLKTDRYEFHKSHTSKVSNTSFIYMLYEIEDITLDLLDNYLEPQKPDSIDIQSQTMRAFETEQKIIEMS